ncbi:MULTISPECIES: undecaprenyl-phosphate 4-deoxy-4-formamido-L-arabinose transferase [Vibrio]|uniref:Undecaprenyl-phosphate 4-deoxy-4-formamido-L-arabinose transferase n=1 Tax=Vibrio mediterranei TaxID=689 RepID=A0A2C9P7K8_9VIBR|nr:MULTISPECIES: undecaprenyl-phosphate 4-deoxy-4-formamido-L-arabinose transferase [Vibrio]ASI88444.1 undecaprenyl-phosphate 4-deoxy-4-formamido-L-arabinose transferase [Vibrio mediterranei]AYV20351.1 undecaprenyl-phosphate 4-deoxy-4-formamido-L-arabinose transferase [Vibrio mediterranei]EDL51890.1 undecaprenyl phosphate 4-deoxy-4-formamido-L-arabinose transferase [Vibrio mediterranei AK1]KFA98957.1 UDP phosphate 4-deoxy-4-formamido-L-arabinose transferase [Vibrio sp. ER1A]MCF4172513.1 undeca
MKHNQAINFVSIVIPVYNEENCLQELIDRTTKASDSLGKDYELILVDDGSRDRSAEIIEEASAKEGSHVVGVILNRNYGQHNAIMAGFEQVRGDLIITLDADLQNPPEEIPNLVAKAEEGFDSVGTVRKNRQDSALRRYPSKLINKLVKRSTGVEMNDYGCMLRAYRRHVVDAMLECHERSTFIPVLANGFSRHTTEIDVHHDERADGESKYSFMKLISLMFDLITSMTTAPLRLLSIVGGGIAAAGIAFGVILMLMRIMFGSEWAGDGLFTLFAILFVFVGAQFVGLGLLGEYIGRIYSDVRARPRFYVQDVLVGEATKNARESDELKNKE